MSNQVEQAEGLLCISCSGEVIRSVTTKCGHAVCMTCLRKNTSAFSCCPICWKFSQMRTLQSGIAVYPKEDICNIHQEDEKMFCRDNQTLFCESCPTSEDHECHIHLPIDVAAHHFRNKIQTNLDILCKQFEKVQELLLKGKEQSLAWTVEWVDYKEMRKRKFWKNFQKICKYLSRKKEAKEELIVEKMNRKINKIYKRLKEIETTQEHQMMEKKKAWEHMMSNLGRFLTDLITELQKVMKKPDIEMLQVVKETLERSDVWLDLEPFTPNLETSYVKIVIQFLKLLQRHNLLESCKDYKLSGEKKRTIKIVPDDFGMVYPIYVFGSLHVKDTTRRFIMMT